MIVTTGYRRRPARVGGDSRLAVHRIRLGVGVVSVAVACSAVCVPSFGGKAPRTSALDVDLLAATALIMTGTDMHVIDPTWIHLAVHNFIAPTLGGDYTGIPLATPEQFWPFTGPNDMSFDISIADGTLDLEQAIASQQTQSGPTDNPTVVFGYSQSAAIASAAKRRLADQVANNGTPAAAVSFVILANPNRPNGGINARFAGAVLESLGWTFTPAAPTDTGFTTIDIARQYDPFADFPTYPLNVIADANAVVALLYGSHDYSGVTLNTADSGYDPRTVVQQYGDTTYYFIPAETLPLLRPLRDLGIDPLVLDAIEPAVRVLVEFGYDRAISFGQPMPAQLVSPENPDQLNSDLAAAIDQGKAILDAETANQHRVPPVATLPTRPTQGPNESSRRRPISQSAVTQQPARLTSRVTAPQSEPGSTSRPRR